VSLLLLIALFLQAATLVLLRYRLGRGWLQRPFVLLAMAAVLYHGVSQLLLTIPAIRAGNIYLLGIDQHYVDEATLYMSAGLLVMAACYLATRPERATAAVPDSGVRLAARIPDWRLCAIAAAPLAVLTYSGRGYNRSLAVAKVAGTGADLAVTFLIVLIALAAFGFLLRYGMRWLVPVLAAQSVLLGAAGERLPIVIGAIELLVLLARVGLRPSRKQRQVAIAITLLVVLGITGFRADQGRAFYHQNSGLRTRAASLAVGVQDLATAQAAAGPLLVRQAAYRFDGDSFAGGVLQGMYLGNPRLGAWQAAQSVLIAVPSVLWPSKLRHPSELDPTVTQMRDFHLQNVNFLPTMLGLYLGFFGPFWLMVVLAGLGALVGWGERRLFRGTSPVHLVVLASAVQAALTYEEGLPGMLVALRTAVVLAAVAWALMVIRGPARSTRRWPRLASG
jgi:hypothetical protein